MGAIADVGGVLQLAADRWKADEVGELGDKAGAVGASVCNGTLMLHGSTPVWRATSIPADARTAPLA
jgi:hypothetical protein